VLPYKRGDKWWIDYRLHGKRIREPHGFSKDAAARYEREMRGKAKLAKKDPTIVLPRPGASLTVEDFLEEYLEWAEVNKTLRSFQRDQYLLSHFHRFLKRRDVVTLIQVTLKDVEDFKTKKLQKVQPSTVRRDLNTIKHVFNMAVEWGRLSANPIAKLKKPTIREREPAFFWDMDQVELLRQTCKGEVYEGKQGRVPGWRVWEPTYFMLCTGVRFTELSRMKPWNGINFDRDEILVPTAKTFVTSERKATHRVVPMEKGLKGMLLRMKKEDRWFDFRNYRRRLQAAARQAGSDGRVVTHTPRHTFGAHHIMHGTDIVTLAQLMGHTATEITEIYAHVTPSHVRRSRGRLPWAR
jgi:site-specific recombinase XerD